MISFASFPSKSHEITYEEARHHPNVKDDLMEFEDYEDFESSGSRLTCPGESLTSSQAYMRFGPLQCDLRLFLLTRR